MFHLFNLVFLCFFVEDNFYDHMKQYLLSKEQLWDNKYPKRDPDNPKGTIIKDYVASTNSKYISAWIMAHRKFI